MPAAVGSGMVDINELSVGIGGVATVVLGLIGLIWKAQSKKLDEVGKKAEEAASREEITRVHSRIDIIEARSHDEIRDLRSDMNGLGQRLEAAFSQRLEPIHQMLTALVNKRD